MLLKRATILLHINLQKDFRKVKRIGCQTLIYFHGVVPEDLIQIRGYLGSLGNVVKVAFTSKSILEASIKVKIHKKLRLS